MNFQACIKTAIALLALGATSAMAEPLTLQATGLPSYLSQGTYQGSFDAGFLPKNVVINSLSFSFLFVDDGDVMSSIRGNSVSSTAPAVREASGDPRGKQAGRTFSETVTTTVTTPWTGVGEQESVSLSFGGATYAGATQEVHSDVTTAGPTRTELPKVLYLKNNENRDVACLKTQWENGTANCQQVTRTVVTKFETRTITTDYTGEIVLGASLFDSKDLLASLLRDRKLDFSLDVLGDLDLFGATLDIDFTPFDDIAVVPEPGSLSLFGVAMLGFAGVRRKRRA